MDIATAKLEMVEFASGRGSWKRADDALMFLQAEAPEEVAKLWQALESGPEELTCSEVTGCLEDYAALGAQAAAVMPGIEDHLGACASCSGILELVVAAHRGELGLRQRTDEAAHLAMIATPSERGREMLTLVKGGWLWLRRQMELSRAEIEQGAGVGDWSLVPSAAPAAGLRFEEPTRAALSMRTAVGVDVAQILLHVIPEDPRWLVRIEMLAGKVAMLEVALGNENETLTGGRQLSEGRPTEFRVATPAERPCWLHLTWQSESGTAVCRLEIPLLAAGDTPPPGGRL